MFTYLSTYYKPHSKSLYLPTHYLSTSLSTTHSPTYLSTYLSTYLLPYLFISCRPTNSPISSVPNVRVVNSDITGRRWHSQDIFRPLTRRLGTNVVKWILETYVRGVVSSILEVEKTNSSFFFVDKSE